MDEILKFDNVGYYYKNGDKKTEILEETSFTFEKGKLYTILGPSGSGKTTTLALASALELPKSGAVIFNGKTLQEIGMTKYRSDSIGIVFQSYNLLNYMNALQNVMMSIEITKNKIDRSKNHAFALLEKLGIGREKAVRNVNKLSGGEQQRVAIARAISTDAELILADEPTGNLDADTAQEIMQIFCYLAHEDGKCVIAVTHSAEFAQKADIVVTLQDKKLLQSTALIENNQTGN